MDRSKLARVQEQKGPKKDNTIYSLHYSFFLSVFSFHQHIFKAEKLKLTPISWLAVNYVILTVCTYCDVLVKLYGVLKNSYITALEVSRMGVAATVAAQRDCGAGTEFIHKWITK